MKIDNLIEALGNLEQHDNPKDYISVDVPLFIRILEWAREEAKSDLEVHQFTENAIKLSSESTKILSMNDYSSLLSNITQK